ncbi:MAG: CoB--CoM heterodisulfide reductase iron-sulfur subunit B family protein [Syntrophales bacterium]|nr:CoB--CoM heterodisulfide reductase iron-sulfur subunit B family protein [Syntrophales bacterium]MDY0043748.1 CoB--CoM heterodisulfide reductase iron-sulfur subunit B family protein [Syntrophales bacterium]
MKVSYYPGCSLHATGKEYDLSVKAVSKALDIELQEVDDWSCCGASSAHMTNYKLSVALPARNIIAAEKDKKDVMVPCAACFNRFKMAQHHMREDEVLKKEVEDMVGGTFSDSVAIRNPIDILYNDVGIDTLSGKVKKKLTGLKPVAYYGCLLLRPPEVCEFENYENPYMLDKIMAGLGAEPRNWSCKTDCCGGSLTLGKTEVVVRLVDKLMTMAREAGANCLVTACPVCFANLDTRASENVRLPAFYFTEIIALALGLEGPDSWFKIHNVDPRPLLKSLSLL